MSPETEPRVYDVSVWIPVFAAIIAALLGILGTVAFSGRGDYVTIREHEEYSKSMATQFTDIEKEISSLDSRLGKIEGKVEGLEPRPRR